MPLDVAGSPTVLLVGGGETAQGEVWLENNTGGDVKIEQARRSRSRSPPSSRPARYRCHPMRRSPTSRSSGCRSASGWSPSPHPGQYVAHVDLTTSIGIQTIPASLVVLAERAGGRPPGAAGVQRGWCRRRRSRPPSSFATSATSRSPSRRLPTNRSSKSSRASGCSASAPAGSSRCSRRPTSLRSPLDLTFTLAATPTIGPAEWARIGIDILVPAGLGTGRHVRALPRIVNDRFNIDLLT